MRIQTVQNVSPDHGAGLRAPINLPIAPHTLTDAFELMGALMPFTRNAEIYAHADAAILLKQSDLSGELLARNIRELMENPQRLQQMAANCARLAPRDAAGRVANTIEKYTTHEAHV